MEEEEEEEEEEIKITASYEQKDVLTSGNAEIDKKIGGGIPVCSLTLIEGPNAAGKSVLTQQIAWGAAQQGFTVASYTTENTAKSLLKQMDSLAFDVSDYFILGKFKIYPIRVRGTEWMEDVPFLNHIASDMERKEEEVILIDSLNVFVSHASERDVIDFFTACKNLCDSNRTILITLHDYVFSEEMLTRVRSICDAHLSLRIEEMENKLVKTMKVAKIRGAQKTTGNIIAFEIEPGFGFRIIPLSKAKA
ncbi:MAG: flagellar accessory protein FlaH [Methanophagales archaeon]|nr:flagellar accessory protein FlaH [Methanophagales archaeon]